MIKSFFVALVATLVLLCGATAVMAATSVGNAVSVGSTLDVTGATTLDGAVTLGDAVNDDITVSGRLGTLTVSDGSTATTTVSYNTLVLGKITGTYNLGKFYVDSSGNVSASGTLATVGNTTFGTTAASSTMISYGNATFTGNIKPQHHNLYDLGSYTQAWNDVFVSGTLYAGSLSLLSSERLVVTNVSSTNYSASGYLDVDGVTTLDGAVTLGDAVNDDIAISGRLTGNVNISDGSTATTTLTYNTLLLGKITGTYNLGKFYVDASGNVSASGTLGIVGATTFNGAVTLGDAANDNIAISGRLTGNVNISDGSTATTTLTYNSLILAKVLNTYDYGRFYVDASGNVSASGTLSVLGATASFAGNILPTANNSKDIGAFGTAYRDAYVSSTLFVGDLSDMLYIDKPNGKIGMGSSTPFGNVSVGMGGATTSTISTGKFCMYAGQENGTNVYVILGANQAANQPFATTSVTCF